MKTNVKRFLAYFMVVAMAMTTVFTSDVMSAYAATSSKTVKTVTLKIGTTNVTKKTKTMNVGSKATLKVTVSPSTAKKSVTFSTSSKSIATVSTTGVITAKSAGKAKITVKVKGKDGKTKSTYCYASVKNVAVSSVKLNKTAATIYVGKTTTLVGTYAPTNATVAAKAFKSYNTAVATVASNGVVKGVKAGTAKIGYTVKGKDGKYKTAYCTVTVKNPYVAVSAVKLNVTTKEMTVGSKYKLIATISPSNATSKTVTWSTSDSSIAVVDKYGYVTAVSEGDVKITAKSNNGKVASCIVSVKELVIPAEDIEVSIDKTTISLGDFAIIDAKILPANATNDGVVFSSSDTTIATVTSNGVIKAVKPGSVVITVASVDGEVKKIISINVSAVAVSSVTIAEKYDLSVGETTNLKSGLVIKPDNASNKNVTWSSSDPLVATVSDGVVTAIKAGTTVITVTSEDGNKTDTCAITVKEDITYVKGVTLKVTGDAKSNENNVFRERTTILGSSLAVAATVTSDDGPIGNKFVTFKVTPIAGNCLKSSSKANFSFQIGNNNTKDITSSSNSDGISITGVTDENGVIQLYCTSSGIKPTDGIFYQSFKIVASSDFSEDNVETATSISFGSVLLDQLEVIDTEIKPNAEADHSNTGVISTIHNGTYIDYVTSQRYSNKATDDDNRVKFTITPYFYMPYAEISENANWETSVNKSISTRSTYNDNIIQSRDEIVEKIPVGTKSLSLVFDKISLSKYSIMYAVILDSFGNTVKTKYIYSDSNKNSENTITIDGINNDTEATLHLFIETKGIVNTANQGCILKSISGFRVVDTNSDYYTWMQMNNAIKWESVKKAAIKYNEKEWEYSNIKSYLPDDTYAEGYRFDVSTPAYPYVGNAILAVTNMTDTSKVDYYSIPTTTIDNENVLVDASKAKEYRVSITEAEALNQVGSITQDNNTVIVDANAPGTTYIKASISISGVDTSDTAGTLFTSVEWTTLPEKLEEDKITDFYAIKGQNIKLKIKCTDSTGKVHKGNVDVISNNISGIDGYTGVFEKVVATNENGFAEITINGKDAKAYVKSLYCKAVETGYNTEMWVVDAKGNEYSIGATSTTKTSYANLYWVELGITYADRAQDEKPTIWTTNFTNGFKEIVDAASIAVSNDVWAVRYIPIAQADTFDYDEDVKSSYRKFVSVSGISIKYSSSDDEKYSVSEINNVANIKSAKTGEMILSGKINLSSDDKDLADIKFTFYNDSSEKVIYNNVGCGTGVSAPGLKLKIDWINDGAVKTELIPADGNTISEGLRQTLVYVKVVDGMGNPIADKEIEKIANATYYDLNQKITNEKGYVALIVKTPTDSFSSQVVTVKVKGGDETFLTINYAGATEFKVDSAKYDTNNKVITVKFNEEISSNATIISKQFVLTGVNGYSYSNYIKSVTVSGNTVTIELHEILPLGVSSYALKVTSAEDEDGLIRNVVDGNGQIVSSASVTITE